MTRNTPLPTVIREFLQDLQLRKHVTPKTVQAYGYDLHIFFTFLVTRQVGAPHPAQWIDVTLDHLRYVTYETIRDFLLQFESPVSSRHQQRKAAVLRSFFRYLVEIRELLDRNPTTRIRVGLDRAQVRAELQQVKALNDQQLTLFLTNVRTGIHLPTDRAKLYHAKVWMRDWAIIMLFLTSGIRLSELAGISRTDLDLVRDTVRVRRKGGFSDWVPLHPDAKVAIAAYFKSIASPLQDERDCPLFMASTTRHRLTGRQIENLVKRYAVTADPQMEFVSPHKLRHTFAQRIYNATGDLYLTAVSLAHSHVDSARIYAKVSEEQRIWAIQRLSLGTAMKMAAFTQQEPG